MVYSEKSYGLYSVSNLYVLILIVMDGVLGAQRTFLSLA